jgi:ribose transport system permease protein
VLRALPTPGGIIWLLLVVLFVLLLVYNPTLTEPGQLMRLIGRIAPFALVALGQYFVIVSGEIDLSMGAVISAQVVLAGNLIGLHDDRILPVMLLMFVVGAGVGLINGLIVTLLRVPSFIATLGTTLVLSGMTFYVTGGAPSGNPSDTFRQIGRGGFSNVPLLGFVPWSVLVLAAVIAVSLWLMSRPFGRLLVAAGDNARATELTGAPVWWLRTRAFMLSSVAGTIAAIVLVGFAGVSPVVGSGYEFAAITAVILGGVALSGGRGWVLSAVAAAFALEVLFSLLSFVGIQSTWRPAVQGAIIVVALAIPYFRGSRRRAPRSAGATAPVPAPSPGESAGG